LSPTVGEGSDAGRMRPSRSSRSPTHASRRITTGDCPENSPGNFQALLPCVAVRPRA
jgi:hypothetical protein